jgi:hypothetical protein
MIDPKAFRDRILADAIASPLRQPAAYTTATVRAEWPEVELYIRQRAAVHCKDLSATDADAESAVQEAIVAWRELSNHAGASYRVMTGLSSVARSLLQPTGRCLTLRVCETDPGREILRWRFISLMIPASILMAAGGDPDTAPSEAVQLLNHSIAPDGDVAELHLHHAAMMSFEEMWASLHREAVITPGSLIRRLSDKRARCPRLHLGPCPPREPARGRSSDDRKHMAEWGDLLRQAFIARYLLDQHSWHQGVELKNCDECNSTTAWRNALQYFVQGRTRPYSLAATPYPWPDGLLSLQRNWRAAKNHVINGGELQRPDNSDAAGERSFLRRATTHIRCRTDDIFDEQFEKLFVQYLRVKTAVFGLLVHPPGEHGLEAFLDRFLQIKVYAPDSELVRPRQRHEPGLKIRATEYRVAPDAWFKTLGSDENDIEDGVTQESVISSSAWLIHFKREKHDNGLPLHGSAIRRMEIDADRIGRALAAKPVRLRKLRGVDICGIEEDQPLWVSAETLRRVRNNSCKVAGQNPGLLLEPLRLTVHAGEDFRWLTSGLRAIAEPFHWNLIERGDRIGHGLAITLDPRGWWDRREGDVIAVKAIDRLLDLAFLAVYADGRSAEQDQWLQLRIEQLTGFLWPPRKSDGVSRDSVDAAQQFWLDLGRRTTRTLLQTPQWNGGEDRLHQRWIRSYLWSRSMQDRAEQDSFLLVDDDRQGLRIESHRTECDLLVKARTRLVHQVALWQVCIESNPSSNLVVGGLDAIAAQDFLVQGLTEEPSTSREERVKLTWTISTDDPITFSTTLADEYAYAWAGMVLRANNPYDPTYARALLDEAAATSMRMRFTTPRPDQERTKSDKRKRRGHARRY